MPASGSCARHGPTPDTATVAVEKNTQEIFAIRAPFDVTCLGQVDCVMKRREKVKEKQKVSMKSSTTNARSAITLLFNRYTASGQHVGCVL